MPSHQTHIRNENLFSLRAHSHYWSGNIRCRRLLLLLWEPLAGRMATDAYVRIFFSVLSISTNRLDAIFSEPYKAHIWVWGIQQPDLRKWFPLWSFAFLEYYLLSPHNVHSNLLVRITQYEFGIIAANLHLRGNGNVICEIRASFFVRSESPPCANQSLHKLPRRIGGSLIRIGLLSVCRIAARALANCANRKANLCFF